MSLLLSLHINLAFQTKILQPNSLGTILLDNAKQHLGQCAQSFPGVSCLALFTFEWLLLLISDYNASCAYGRI